MSVNKTLLFSKLLSSLNAEKLQQIFRIAEQCERYDDMCEIVTKLVQLRFKQNQDLTYNEVNERESFTVAFKKVIRPKLTAYRVVNAGFDNNDSINAISIHESLETYQTMVGNELQKACEHILDLLMNYLLKTVEGKSNEDKVFYLKLVGDHYRYLAELNSNDYSNGENSRIYYEKAFAIAESELHPCNKIRLGLALNLAVCYYEIIKDSQKACDLAKKAFDDSIGNMDCISEEMYKQATLIMQLMEDNLRLWTHNDYNMTVLGYIRENTENMNLSCAFPTEIGTIIFEYYWIHKS